MKCKSGFDVAKQKLKERCRYCVVDAKGNLPCEGENAYYADCETKRALAVLDDLQKTHILVSKERLNKELLELSHKRRFAENIEYNMKLAYRMELIKELLEEKAEKLLGDQTE